MPPERIPPPLRVPAVGASAWVVRFAPLVAPGARVLELGDWGWRETQWDDLEVVSHYRGFLDSPERYLRHLR